MLHCGKAILSYSRDPYKFRTATMTARLRSFRAVKSPSNSRLGNSPQQSTFSCLFKVLNDRLPTRGKWKVLTAWKIVDEMFTCRRRISCLSRDRQTCPRDGEKHSLHPQLPRIFPAPAIKIQYLPNGLFKYYKRHFSRLFHPLSSL